MTQPVAILIAALGGQGGGVLAEWLVDAAARAGYRAQGTSIPGVAQRTGATTYYVEVYPEPVAAGQARQPVLGLYPVPGGVDLLVASELLEAVRSVQAGYVSPDRTTLVASESRTLTTFEKMAQGDGRFDRAKLLDVARAQSRRLCTFDMDAAAREAGTVVSAVMAGAIAATGVLPFPRTSIEEAIRASGALAEASLRGFARGFDAVAVARAAPATAAEAATDLHETAAAEFPPATRAIVAAGVARVAEFQDRTYASLYLERLRLVLAAERDADPNGRHGHALTRETARFLALWMAFDDVVRVAALKCRASRFARVRRELAAKPGDIVRVYDYLKPGIPELAGLLPPALARQALDWDRRRQARGKAPFALAVRLRADGVTGIALLRLLAGLRRLRRRGARYADEQARIERWLASIEAAARSDWTLAHEIALCGRLVKGYGATNERGKRNLAHILEHLASGGPASSPLAKADAVRQAREAALADEQGKALDATLIRHGAPPRPPVARPIVWVRKPARRDRPGRPADPREGGHA